MSYGDAVKGSSTPKKCTYLRKVLLSADVYAICIQHALSTEREEIMGLLIGEVDEESGISKISAPMILHRSDKLPDRVEISPEQLYAASMHADKLSQQLNRPMRVLGWYHSHPHITVLPSHVDVCTQSNYQMLDPLFVGLIFAVFLNEKNAHVNSLKLICFQAQKIDNQWQRREIPLEVTNSILNSFTMDTISQVPDILMQEEAELYKLYDNDAKSDILATLHNNAMRTRAFVHIISKICKPLCDSLDARVEANALRIKALNAEKETLLELLKKEEVTDLLS